jgi:N-acetylglucosamine-6-phosphate deacetylase
MAGETVVSVGEGTHRAATRLPDGWTILPGLVDTHVHGAAGHDFMDGDLDAVRAAAAAHAKAGSTTVIASTVTAPLDVLQRQAGILTQACENGWMSGIHLEGPWLSPTYRGAHSKDFLTHPHPDQVRRLLAATGPHLKAVTIAPELPHALDAVAMIAAAGARIAIGHTAATFEQTRAAIEAGATLATHLCNAMPSIHHRDPGPVAALLAADTVRFELIADGHHLHPAMLALLAGHTGAAGRWMLVSDAIRLTGTSAVTGSLGDQTVTVADGSARTSSGALAGSVAFLIDGVRNAIDAGIPMRLAVNAASAVPARAHGIPGAGRIEVGGRADLVAVRGGSRPRRPGLCLLPHDSVRPGRATDRRAQFVQRTSAPTSDLRQ